MLVYECSSDVDCWDRSVEKWRLFDYRDWAVAGPIAERYGLIVSFHRNWAWHENVDIHSATPQKAIALAVIKMAKAKGWVA